LGFVAGKECLIWVFRKRLVKLPWGNEPEPLSPAGKGFMQKKKIFNDPVYGFVSVPYGILFELLEHPYFQRLRRIKQVSMTHYVYPGALHTRFHHALGAFHLMTQALEVLRSKGVDVSPEECEAACIGILLHDIGHGPFSHTLENTLIGVSHEQLSLLFMQQLNDQFDGALDLAIQIFQNSYPKHFLHQLISGQLDMDRMDYLSRDSFYTGVYEGVISYDRIIKMLAVHEGELVVEEKGIYSLEKFLIARRLMYWQVYLHKTVLSAEQMLIRALARAKDLTGEGKEVPASPALQFFLQNPPREAEFLRQPQGMLERFARLDDFDITAALKAWVDHPDPLLAYFARGLIHRRLFKLELRNEPFEPAYVDEIEQRVQQRLSFPKELLPYLVYQGKETNHTYNTSKEEIMILYKNGTVAPLSLNTDHDVQPRLVTKYYLSYPKEVANRYHPSTADL